MLGLAICYLACGVFVVALAVVTSLLRGDLPRVRFSDWLAWVVALAIAILAWPGLLACWVCEVLPD